MPEHIVSKRTFAIVWLVLLGLTASTIGLAYVNLHGWNTVIALGIAIAKAMLIGLFFMHVRYSTGIMRLVVLAGLLWLGILISGTMNDYLTRGWLAVPGK